MYMSNVDEYLSYIYNLYTPMQLFSSHLILYKIFVSEYGNYLFHLTSGQIVA